MKLFINSIFLCLLSVMVQAQSGPDLFSIPTNGKGSSFSLSPEGVIQITDRKEYDSQPNFINEYQMMFSAADEKGNHDIIAYNFETKKFTNLSKTSDRGEFSPTITDCGQYISAVVMEEDQRQRIWLYPTNFEPAELLYDDIEPVGYYDWYDNKGAMFILGDPNKLVYANGRDDIWTLDTNVARGIKKRPKSAQITYLSQSDKNQTDGMDAFGLRTYDLKTKEKTEHGYGLPGSQDLIWIDKNHLVMARDSQIFLRNLKKDDWTLLATIPVETHHNITRLAYSADLNLLVFAMDRK